MIKRIKRLISLTLVMVFLLTLLPGGVLATGFDEASDSYHSLSWELGCEDDTSSNDCAGLTGAAASLSGEQDGCTTLDIGDSVIEDKISFYGFLLPNSIEATGNLKFPVNSNPNGVSLQEFSVDSVQLDKERMRVGETLTITAVDAESCSFKADFYLNNQKVGRITGTGSLSFVPEEEGVYSFALQIRKTDMQSAYFFLDHAVVVSGNWELQAVSVNTEEAAAGSTIVFSAVMSQETGTQNPEGSDSALLYYFAVYKDGNLYKEVFDSADDSLSMYMTEPGEYYCVCSVVDDYGTESTATSSTVTIVTETQLNESYNTPTHSNTLPVEALAGSSSSDLKVAPGAVTITWSRQTNDAYYLIRVECSKMDLLLEEENYTGTTYTVSASDIYSGYDYYVSLYRYDSSGTRLSRTSFHFSVTGVESLVFEDKPRFLVPKKVQGEECYVKYDDLTVQWTKMNYASTIEIKLKYSCGINMHEILLTTVDGKDDTYTIPKSVLANGAYHELQIKAYDAFGNTSSNTLYFNVGEEGTVEEFNIEATTLTSTFLSDGSELYSVPTYPAYEPIRLNWLDVPAAAYFSVHLFDYDNNNQETAYDLINAPTFVIDPAALVSGHRYQVRVYSHHTAECYERSDDGWFRAPYVGSLQLDPPKLTTEELSTEYDDPTIITLRPLSLVWEPESAAVSYSVTLYNLEADEPDFEESGITATQVTIPQNVIWTNDLYELSVGAEDAAGNAAYSVFYLKFVNNDLTAPALLTPILSTDRNDFPICSLSNLPVTWSAVADAAGYRFQLFDYYMGDWDKILDVDQLTDAAYTIPKGKLYMGGKFKFRIKAVDAYGNGKWSDTYYFRVGAAGYISLSDTERSVSAAAGRKAFFVTSGEGWTATSSDSWLSISETSGTGSQQVAVIYTENTGEFPRTASITFTNSEGGTAVYTVTQEGQSSKNSGALRITSPKQGSILDYASFRATWKYNYNHAYYQFSLKDTVTGTLVHTENNIIMSYADIPISALVYGHAYRLTVGVYDAQGNRISEGSVIFAIDGFDTQTFIEAEDQPVVVGSSNPEGSTEIRYSGITDGAEIDQDNILITWENVINADHYWVALRDMTLYPDSIPSEEAGKIINQRVDLLKTCIISGQLTPGHEYRLWIAANRNDGSLIDGKNICFSVKPDGIAFQSISATAAEESILWSGTVTAENDTILSATVSITTPTLPDGSFDTGYFRATDLNVSSFDYASIHSGAVAAGGVVACTDPEGNAKTLSLELPGEYIVVFHVYTAGGVYKTEQRTVTIGSSSPKPVLSGFSHTASVTQGGPVYLSGTITAADSGTLQRVTVKCSSAGGSENTVATTAVAAASLDLSALSFSTAEFPEIFTGPGVYEFVIYAAADNYTATYNSIASFTVTVVSSSPANVPDTPTIISPSLYSLHDAGMELLFSWQCSDVFHCIYNVLDVSDGEPGISLLSGSTDNSSVTIPGEKLLAGHVIFCSVYAENADGAVSDVSGAYVVLLKNNMTLNVSAEEFTFAASTGSKTLKITSPIDWTAEVTVGNPWLSLSKAQGSGDASVKINVQKNTGDRPRHGTIRIQSDYGTINISVSQGADVSPYLNLSTTTVEMNAVRGLSADIEVESNCGWYVESDSEWLYSSTYHEVFDGTLQICAEANTSTAPRSGSLTIKAGNVTKVITVYQNGAENPTLSAVTVSVEQGKILRPQGLVEAPNGCFLDRVTIKSDGGETLVTVQPEHATTYDLSLLTISTGNSAVFPEPGVYQLAVYASVSNSDREECFIGSLAVEVTEAIDRPEIENKGVTELSATSVTLNADVVNLAGEELSQCYFQLFEIIDGNRVFVDNYWIAELPSRKSTLVWTEVNNHMDGKADLKPGTEYSFYPAMETTSGGLYQGDAIRFTTPEAVIVDGAEICNSKSVVSGTVSVTAGSSRTYYLKPAGGKGDAKLWSWAVSGSGISLSENDAEKCTLTMLTVGTYTLTATLEDYFGNSYQKLLTIEVKEKPTTYSLTFQDSAQDDKPHTWNFTDNPHTWDFTDNPHTWDFTFDPGWFEHSSYEYDHNLAKLSMGMLLAAQSSVSNGSTLEARGTATVLAMYKKFGFDEDDIAFYNYNVPLNNDDDKIAFSIAHRTIQIGGEEQDLIFIITRGAHYGGGEWVSNFRITGQPEGSEHFGFNMAATRLESVFMNYCAQENITIGENTKILLTGFSRTAAVSNLVGAWLNNENKYFRLNGGLQKNVFVYAFATPNVSTSTSLANNLNIYNILTKDDLVPRVPMSEKGWDFGKNGVYLYLPSYASGSSTLLPVYGPNGSMRKICEGYTTLDYADQTWAPQKEAVDLFSSVIAKTLGSLSAFRSNNCQPVVTTITQLIWNTAGVEEEIGSLKDILLYYILWVSMPSGLRWYVESKYGNEATAKIAEDSKALEIVVRLVKNIFELSHEQKNLLVEYLFKVSFDELLGYVDAVIYQHSTIGIALSAVHLDDASARVKQFENHMNYQGRLDRITYTHKMENYLAWLEAYDPDSLNWTEIINTIHSTYHIQVTCPVDVYVYETSGELLGCIVNDEIDESLPLLDDVLFNVDGDVKTLILPAGKNYRVDVVPYADGECAIMTAAETLGGELVGCDYYSGLPLEGAKQYTLYCGTENDEARYRLYDADLQIVDCTHSAEVLSVDVAVEGMGLATGSCSALTGEYVTLSADTTFLSDFLGWYLGDELISTAPELTVCVMDSITYTARFSSIYMEAAITEPENLRWEDDTALWDMPDEQDEGILDYEVVVYWGASRREVAEMTQTAGHFYVSWGDAFPTIPQETFVQLGAQYFGFMVRARSANPDVMENGLWAASEIMKLEEPAFAITAQPENATAATGSTVSFTVAASGSDLSYQWQVSTNGGNTWKNSRANGNKTPTLSFTAAATHNSYQFRCVVTDSGGQTATSNAATLTITAAGPSISNHPTNVSASVGTKVNFSVTASGSDLTYQWQASTNGGKTWVNSGASGNKTPTLSFTAAATHNGYQFRCIVSASDGQTATSDAATLTITSPGPSITDHPADVTAAAGTKVNFSVSASGSDLTYQWQASTNGGKTWVNSGASGNKTPTLSFTAAATHNGYMFRCIVSASDGQTATSDAATLTVAASGPSIIDHPADVTAAAGTKVSFSVTASGSGFSYQWQASTDGGKNWKNSGTNGNKAPTLSFTAAAAHNGYMFRCVVTDSGGQTATSNAATLTIAASTPSITKQPANAAASAGEKVTFTVTASGATSYQWQVSTNNGATWVNSGAGGNKTATLSFTAAASHNGYLFRCIVTGNGESVTSNAVTLTVN